METYLEQYRHKDIRDIHALVKEFNCLSTEAMSALDYVIRERNLQEEFSEEELNKIETELKKREEGIQNLEYLNLLGVFYNEIGEKKIVRRSNMAWWNNFWGIIVGVLLIVFMQVVFTSISDLIKGDGNVFSVVSAGLGAFLAASGGVILYRSIERSLSYNAFKVVKSNYSISLQYRPEMKTEKVNLSLNAKFELITSEKGVALCIKDDEKQYELLHFKEVQDIHEKSIQVLNEVF